MGLELWVVPASAKLGAKAVAGGLGEASVHSASVYSDTHFALAFLSASAQLDTPSQ